MCSRRCSSLPWRSRCLPPLPSRCGTSSSTAIHPSRSTPKASGSGSADIPSWQLASKETASSSTRPGRRSPTQSSARRRVDDSRPAWGAASVRREEAWLINATAGRAPAHGGTGQRSVGSAFGRTTLRDDLVSSVSADPARSPPTPLPIPRSKSCSFHFDRPQSPLWGLSLSAWPRSPQRGRSGDRERERPFPLEPERARGAPQLGRRVASRRAPVSRANGSPEGTCRGRASATWMVALSTAPQATSASRSGDPPQGGSQRSRLELP